MTASENPVTCVYPPMLESLEHVLAGGVLEALREREYVAVCPEAEDALRDELVAVITPSVASIEKHLQAERSRKRPGRAVRQGSLGHGPTEEAVVDLVEVITDRLMESDHVQDVFAEDRLIRRDVLRALRRLLLAYLRGEVVLEVDRGLETFDVVLPELGYVVSGVCDRADPNTIYDALVVAASACGGRLCSLDASRAVAVFELPGGAEAGRLALEEAITEETMALVRAGIVPLPSIEQLLEISPDVPLLPGFSEAIERAETRTRHRTGCDATCRLLDDTTVLVSITPLSSEAADEAQDHFQRFLGLLEEALNTLTSGERQPEKDPEPDSTKRRREAPKSEPRKKGVRANGSGGRASRTRSRGRAKTKRAK